MTQELADLRMSILEGRYADALAIVDDLESMGRKGIIRNIKSFLIRMLIHLIKNQIELRMTNSWAASIRDSVIEIQELNLQDNQTSYYIKAEDWQSLLEECLARAISTASVEVREGYYTPFQLKNMVAAPQTMQITQELLNLTYQHSAIDLPDIINEYLTQLPGGADWKSGHS
ncbi:MAG TPA: DUF29 family protein [Oscillatoriaceae cyanobacterium M33_DOE_052]|uniref:DUF29 family protein n=1 Tax=Planktothricoides sp. SpSt-374 TaxID=2282167 RepID=A0A7C3ZUE7_9CYAN|nr:DUF29 family protein [Oscillatoriaceae cyanobacterium M33_DOE_052]